MNKATISALMIAVAVLATGCKKDADPSTGPAQEAGAAIDNAGAKVAEETKEAGAAIENSAERAAENVDQAADKAAANIDQATDKAAANMREAGAEVRQETKEAAAEVRQGADAINDKAGKAVERAGEKMQDGK
ncbi:hypothetical protein [Massilia sp. SYSU DXS3249]